MMNTQRHTNLELHKLTLKKRELPVFLVLRSHLCSPELIPLIIISVILARGSLSFYLPRYYSFTSGRVVANMQGINYPEKET